MENEKRPSSLDIKEKACESKRNSEDGGAYLFREMINKLLTACAHIQSVKHDCDHCVAIQCIQWCVDYLNDFDSISSIKKFMNESDDKDLGKLLSKFAKYDESSGEVANYLSNNYRNNRTSVVSKPPSRRHSLRTPDDFMEPKANDIINLLSVGKKPQKSLSWLVEQLDDWDCDIFRLADFTAKPLTTSFYAIMEKRNLFETLNIPRQAMISFMYQVETYYHDKNPFHNNLHAADVTQTMHYLLLTSPLSEALTDVEIFALIFASAIHDVDHPGFNNPYLVKVKSPLAVLYNDIHILENHSLAVVFKLLYASKENCLENFNDSEAEIFRNLVIRLVLATDMSMHVNVTSALQICIEKFLVGNVLVLDKFQNRMDLMKGLLHFADISNPTKPLNLYKKWTQRITDEFFAQGDRERESGLPVSPLCDRHKTDFGKGQPGFIDFIVRPLCDIIVKLLCTDENCKPNRGQMVQDHLDENYLYFKGVPKFVSVNQDEKMGNFSKNAGHKVHHVNTTKCLVFKTPQFFQVFSRPNCEWNRDFVYED